MCKTKLIIAFLFISFYVALAQNIQFPIAIGVSYEKIVDAGRGYQFNQGITAEYNTKRERMVLEAFYGLSKRLKMKSAMGASFYNSELKIGQPINPAFTQLPISNLYFVISQSVMYDLLNLPGIQLYESIYLPAFDFLEFKLSPYITLDYEHLLNKMQNAKGFSDLTSNEANQWITKYDIPALGGTTKIPVGILSVGGGLSFEVFLFKKIGINYNFGYSHSLFGHSSIDAQFRYKDNEIHTLNLQSKDSGILQKIGLRYYF